MSVKECTKCLQVILVKDKLLSLLANSRFLAKSSSRYAHSDVLNVGSGIHNKKDSDDVDKTSIDSSGVEDEAIRRRQSVIINSILYRTHLLLKDVPLFKDEDVNLKKLHMLSKYKLLGRKRHSRRRDRKVLCADQADESLPDISQMSSINNKEAFVRKICEKYQSPPRKIAEHLLTVFQDPRKLYHDVVSTVADAGVHCVQPVVLTNHLGGLYWKACVEVLWPIAFSVTGKHPEKEQALNRMYLGVCQKWKDRGILHYTDNEWKLVSSSNIIGMLETLSQSGDSIIGSSKGRGFKIVLERIKEDISDIQAHDLVDGRLSHLNQLTSSNYKSTKNVEVKNDMPFSDKASIANYKHKGLISFEKSISSFVKGTSKTSSELNSVADSDTFTQGIRQSATVQSLFKPRWKCCVHVGWPVPFSVRVDAISLPSAQMLGLMAALAKMKVFELVSECNSQISAKAIINIAFLETKRQWLKNLRHESGTECQASSNADAEIFADASKAGFGAYLILRDEEKVNWISESWSQHDHFHSIMKSNSKVKLVTCLSELFSLVTVVFTWKQKLRHKTVQCFTDNVMTASLITSFSSTSLSKENISHYDQLLHILQQTCQNYHIDLRISWLERQRNWLADALSRENNFSFLSAIPNAAHRKTRVKKLKLRKDVILSLQQTSVPDDKSVK